MRGLQYHTERQQMNTDQEIADAIRIVISAGYSVTWESPNIGKAGQGIHIHESDLLPKDSK